MKVIYANKKAVRAQVVRSVRKLAEARPEIRKVVWFGSYATDRYAPRSDVDLLIVIDASEKPLRDRIPDYLPDDLEIPVDVFPYTQDELERRLEEGNHFVRRALREGEVVFERSSG